MIVAAAFFFVIGSILVNIFHPIAALQNSNDAIRKTDLNTLDTALETYYQKYKRYPDASNDFKIMVSKQSLQWGQDGFVPYLTVLPQDPLSNHQYVYYTADNNQAFWLYASLENNADSQACGKNCNFGNGDIPATACSKSDPSIQCNYGVSSSNVTP